MSMFESEVTGSTKYTKVLQNSRKEMKNKHLLNVHTNSVLDSTNEIPLSSCNTFHNSAVTTGRAWGPGPPKILNLEIFFPKDLCIIASSVQYKNFLQGRCQRGLFKPF